MKCQKREQQMQHAGDKRGKMEEEQSQEANHRALNFRANIAQSSGIASWRGIKWPPANNRGEWQEFDSDIVEILRVAAKIRIGHAIEIYDNNNC